MSRILVTGAAGFIGFHVSQGLLKRGHRVLGLDNLSPYYDPKLKEARLGQLVGKTGFSFERVELAERIAVERVFDRARPEIVLHLAAQPGVRYSLQNPYAYIDSNVLGFLNVLEGSRRAGVRHLVFASSSSVYGGNRKTPFSTSDNVDHPVSLYAATKKSNELMAHSYSHVYALPVTGLRFFTVYGPWGRPDMATMLFSRAILRGEPIKVFNHGNMERDFTYVTDVVEGVVRIMDLPPAPDPGAQAEADPSTSTAPYRIYNIGNSAPVPLMRFIEVLAGELGKAPILELLPMQPGDVPATFADVSDLEKRIGFRPGTPIEEGLSHFARWYVDYYGRSPA
jgi:UDP-glucuronate 4-epimerase